MAAQFYKINYKSDFVLTINSDAGWAVPFCIKFWTGMPSQAYFAGFDGENYVNCRVGETPTQLLVMFDDHNMPIGELKMQIAYHTTIEEFPDRNFDEVTNPINVTVDIDGTEYQVMLDFTGESGAEIDFSMPSSGVMSVNGKIGYVTLNAEDVGAQPTIEDLATIRSGAAEGATAVQPAELQEGLATKQNVIEDISTIRSGAAAGATAVQPATLQEGLATKQNVIEDLATIRNGAAAGATAYQKPGTGIPETDLASSVQSSLDKADAAAPQSNTYTKSEVNELVEEAVSHQTMIVTISSDGNYTADKTFAEIKSFLDSGGTVMAKDEQDGESYYYLDNYIASEVVFTRDIWGSGGFSTRYYTIDNTNAVSFIDSVHHISSAVDSSSTANLANSAAVKTVNDKVATKQDTISDLATIRSGAAAGATAVQPATLQEVLATKQNVIEDLATIRSGAAAGATAVQPAAMNTALAAKQDTLTFDNAPTANSNNPVKSGGIKTALDAKQSTISTVNVTVDNNTGTPSGSASVSGSTLTLSFQNLKGATGATGATGPQGPQGERGLPGESGVTGDVSGFTVIQTIDPSATYGATDIAGAATVQATNQELTELASNDFSEQILSATGTPTGSIPLNKSMVVGNKYYLKFTTSAQTFAITLRSANGSAAPITQTIASSQAWAAGTYIIPFVCTDATAVRLRIGESGNWSGISSVELYASYAAHVDGEITDIKSNISDLKDELYDITYQFSWEIGSLSYSDNEVKDYNISTRIRIKEYPSFPVATTLVISINSGYSILLYSKNNYHSASWHSGTTTFSLDANEKWRVCFKTTPNDTTFTGDANEIAAASEITIISSYSRIDALEDNVSALNNNIDNISGTLDGLTAEISYEDIGMQQEEIVFASDDKQTVYGKITPEYSDFHNLKSNGKDVVTGDIKQEEIGEVGESVELENNGETILKAKKEYGYVRNLRVRNLNISESSTDYYRIKELESEITRLKESISPLYGYKVRNNGTLNTISLANSNGGKYLITLHKRANDNNFDTVRSAYMPNAQKDFSDVRVYDANGNTFKYDVLVNGNYDVVEVPSLNVLHGNVQEYNSVLYCGGKDGCIRKSTDGGMTWTVLTDLSDGLASSVSVCLITSNGVMFIGGKSDGKLYRSEYPFATKTMVLDENEIHSGSTILPTSVTEDNNGNIYVGHYQLERDIIIEKSTDGGNTFSICYRDDSGKYQHIHRISFNPYNNKVYAGCDGGGGILVSDDNGTTWIDLRDLHTIPQTTDYGMLYCESGFRLFGGETSIVGGASIIKSTDDQNFETILSVGKACYYVIKVDGHYIGNFLSSNNFRYTQLAISDNLRDWSLLYTSSQHNDGGASDGLRELTKLSSNTFIAVEQNVDFNTVLGFVGGNNYYAQILVDVPSGVNTIYVEDGYAARKITQITYDEKVSSPLFYAPLNNLSGKYYMGNTEYTDGIVEWLTKGGRHIGDIFPYIMSLDDKECVSFSNDWKPFASKTLTLPNSYHIGFWLKSDGICSLFYLLYSENYNVRVVTGSELYINDKHCGAVNMPVYRLEGVYMRIDINIVGGTSVEGYVNAVKVWTVNTNVPTIPSSATMFDILVNKSPERQSFVLQHLEITSGVLSENNISMRYNCGVTDNK